MKKSLQGITIRAHCRAEGACLSFFGAWRFLTAKAQSNPYRLAPFLFPFLFFCLLGFMGDT
jgi:hypothetical protein